MIETFKHKGIKEFFTKGKGDKIPSKYKRKIKMILEILNAASDLNDINFPGSNLHKLQGEMKEYWSVKVNGNWRIIFKFDQGKVFDVNFIDYH